MQLFRAFVACAVAALFAYPSSGQQPATALSDDYSGMYSFLKEGEFMQITIEEKGKVSGFISRFGDSGSDKGTFIDQFFKSGKFDSQRITFTTETVHGIWFAFEGDFVKAGKKPDAEGYFLLRGRLTRNSVTADRKEPSQAANVEFKSFPRDAAPPQ